MKKLIIILIVFQVAMLAAQIVLYRAQRREYGRVTEILQEEKP